MKRAFKVKKKAFFIIFKGLSVVKNGLRHESAPLRLHWRLIFGGVYVVLHHDVKKLFNLFQIYTSVRSMDVFNGCYLVQLKKSIGY